MRIQMPENRFIHLTIMVAFIVIPYIVVAFLTKRLPFERQEQFFTHCLVLSLTYLAGYRPFVAQVEKRTPQELPFRGCSTPLMKGMLIGFCLALFVISINWMISEPVIYWRNLTPTLLFGAFSLSFIAATGEEIIFRGFLLRFMLKRFRPIHAMVIQSMLFSLVHFPTFPADSMLYTALHLFHIFLVGVLLTLVFRHYGTLWVPIGLHFAWDFVLFGVGGMVDPIKRLFSLPGVVSHLMDPGLQQAIMAGLALLLSSFLIYRMRHRTQW